MSRARFLSRVARVTYRALMVVYPTSFRHAYGHELRDVFAQACEDRRAREGFAGVARRFARAFLDVPRLRHSSAFSSSQRWRPGFQRAAPPPST